MTDTLSQQEEMAFPFIEAAIGIDTAKQRPDDKDLLVKVLDNNVSLWLYFKNLLTQDENGLSRDTQAFLIQASEFMIKAAQLLLNQVDDELMNRLITLNLNMSELLLQNKGEGSQA